MWRCLFYSGVVCAGVSFPQDIWRKLSKSGDMCVGARLIHISSVKDGVMVLVQEEGRKRGTGWGR